MYEKKGEESGPIRGMTQRYLLLLELQPMLAVCCSESAGKNAKIIVETSLDGVRS